jgi:hypothetical protein
MTQERVPERIETKFRVLRWNGKGDTQAIQEVFRVVGEGERARVQPLGRHPVFLRYKGKRGRVEIWTTKTGNDVFERIGDTNELRKIAS